MGAVGAVFFYIACECFSFSVFHIVIKEKRCTHCTHCTRPVISVGYAAPRQILHCTHCTQIQESTPLFDSSSTVNLLILCHSRLNTHTLLCTVRPDPSSSGEWGKR